MTFKEMKKICFLLPIQDLIFHFKDLPKQQSKAICTLQAIKVQKSIVCFSHKLLIIVLDLQLMKNMLTKQIQDKKLIY